MKLSIALLLSLACMANNVSHAADAEVLFDRNERSAATAEFKFKRVGAPSQTDAGNQAKIVVLQGTRDPNGGNASCLNDGQLPKTEDAPRDNFFFRAGSRGGRLRFDLPKVVDIERIQTYSWHADVRGPQVYKLYGGNAETADFKADPGRDDPAKVGWVLLAEVDTRTDGKALGGQYGVSIAGKENARLGKFQHLLFEIAATETDNSFGLTFFSEIDILDGQEYPPPKPTVDRTVLKIGDKIEITFDTSDLPEIKPWVDEKLKPICAEWYPKIVELLPSDNYEAPQKFNIVFHRNMDGVANTAGTQVNCAGTWFLRNLNGEAAGAVVHELVHVVQQYGRVRGGQRNPSWLVEGVADYIRWFLYEPADQRPRVNPARAKYTDSYRTTAAFLNFVMAKHDADIVKKFNADMRQGNYDEESWKKYTGKTAQELWDEYVATLK